jgi:P4 family phage/plasmid primase-like protien
MVKNNFSSKNIKMDKRSDDFLKAQLDIYDSRGITYISADLYISSIDETTGKIKKDLKHYPNNEQYDQGFITNRDIKKNGSFIPLGEKYNLLIIDVDTKGDNPDTEKIFNKFIDKHDINLNTFTVKTINNGYHYYFKLNDEQKTTLKEINFKKSYKRFLNIDVDILYDKLAFGCAKVEYEDKYYKYKISNDTKIRTLPDLLFNEIVKSKSGLIAPPPQKKNIKRGQLRDSDDEDDEDEPETEIKIELKPEIKPEPELNINDKRIKIYLDACSNIKTRDDWLIIGTVIYNEGGSFELFNNFSKQYPQYYNEQGCINTWADIQKNKKPSNMSTLKKIIKQTTNNKNETIFNLEVQDTTALINKAYKNNSVSDDFISNLFYSLYPNDFIYLPEYDLWFSLNQYGIWEEEGKENMKARAIIKKELTAFLLEDNKTRLKKAIDAENPDLEKQIKLMHINLNKYLTKATNKKNIVSELCILYQKPKLYEKFDTINPYLFGFSNGVYDLKNNCFRNANPEELITCTTKYEYKPPKSNKIKIVNDIFKDIFPDVQECNYIKKILSLGLLADNPLEEFYVFIGTGSNGKGVISTLTKALLGNHYDTLDIEYLAKGATKNATGADPNIARKKNVRMVITSEPEASIKLREGKLKELSGRDEIQCRNLYKEPFNYTPYFKIIIQTNWAPEIDGSDMGMKRRLRLINFPNTFVETPTKANERQLNHKVKSEYPKDEEILNAYFSILLEHFQELKTNNFKLVLPERFKNDTNNFFTNNDPIGVFLNSRCEITEKGKIKSSDLFNDFLNFCNDNNFEKMSHKKFSEILSNKGHLTKKSNGVMVYTTINLKEEKEEIIDFDNEPCGNIMNKLNNTKNN